MLNKEFAKNILESNNVESNTNAVSLYMDAVDRMFDEDEDKADIIAEGFDGPALEEMFELANSWDNED